MEHVFPWLSALSVLSVGSILPSRHDRGSALHPLMLAPQTHAPHVMLMSAAPHVFLISFVPLQNKLATMTQQVMSLATLDL